MSSELHELPDGWSWTRLAEVAEIGSDQVLPNREPDRLFNYVALENVEQGTGRLIDFSQTRGSDIGSNKFHFTPEHILYGKLRPYLRKALVPDFQGVSATDLLPLRPKPDLLDRRFLWRWLLSHQVLEYVVARQTGVKMPRLRTIDLQALPVPLPPLAEQLRIIERVETLFVQSLTAREALDRVPAMLKRFRQAVLAAAFRGELSERDPNDEPAAVILRVRGQRPSFSKRVKSEPINFSDLPELPASWCWTSAGEIIDMLQYGTSVKADSDAGSGIPVLRMGNIQEGQLDFGNLKYIRIFRLNSSANPRFGKYL